MSDSLMFACWRSHYIGHIYTAVTEWQTHHPEMEGSGTWHQMAEIRTEALQAYKERQKREVHLASPRDEVNES